MEVFVEWLASNWTWIVVVLFVLDKITKFTPTPYDDFVFDVIGTALRKLVGKETKASKNKKERKR